MVNSNSIWENNIIHWLFTDAHSEEVEETLESLNRAYRAKTVSEEFYNHYSFMLNTRFKKFKLIETLNR